MIVWAAQRTGSSQLMNWLYPHYKFKLKESLPIPFPNLELFNPDIGACRGLNIETVLKQDLLAKVHPDSTDWDIIKQIVEHSKSHKHVLLYRKNTYDRILSKMVFSRNFDIDYLIVNEIVAREKYSYIVDKLNPHIISYEDIYIKKDKKLLMKIFPDLNPETLFNTKRDDNFYNENNIKYNEFRELKYAVSQLPEFVL